MAVYFGRERIEIDVEEWRGSVRNFFMTNDPDDIEGNFRSLDLYEDILPPENFPSMPEITDEGIRSIMGESNSTVVSHPWNINDKFRPLFTPESLRNFDRLAIGEDDIGEVTIFRDQFLILTRMNNLYWVEQKSLRLVVHHDYAPGWSEHDFDLEPVVELLDRSVDTIFELGRDNGFSFGWLSNGQLHLISPGVSTDTIPYDFTGYIVSVLQILSSDISCINSNGEVITSGSDAQNWSEMMGQESIDHYDVKFLTLTKLSFASPVIRCNTFTSTSDEYPKMVVYLQKGSLTSISYHNYFDLPRILSYGVYLDDILLLGDALVFREDVCYALGKKGGRLFALMMTRLDYNIQPVDIPLDLISNVTFHEKPSTQMKSARS